METSAPADNFDPQKFLLVDPMTFHDLKVGQVYRAPSRTITAAHVAAFQTISLDNHPRHFNEEYAQAHKLQGMLVHPLQVLSFAALGATLLTHYIGEVLISFTDVSAKFHRDSFIGDTIYSALSIDETTESDGKGHVQVGITMHNQRGELVVTGTQTLLLKL